MRTPRPFTGMPLDRVSIERKDPTRIARLLADHRARAVLAGENSVLMADGNQPSLLRSSAQVVSSAEAVLLGVEPDTGIPLFAADMEALTAAERAQLTREGRLVPMREAGVILSAPEAGLAAYLAALLNWHRRHRFCANCGVGTRIEEAGHSRRCPSCGTHHFPRTDPVVIMTVEHDARLLLGRRTGWPPGRCSVLAGFVSPGESAEEAVVREVEEESGIVARDPVFVASQPWPFPSSLMLGFDAQSDGGEPGARDGELEEVRWYPLDEVRAAAREENPDLQLPPPVSIARFLIERWVAAHDA